MCGTIMNFEEENTQKNKDEILQSYGSSNFNL